MEKTDITKQGERTGPVPVLTDLPQILKQAHLALTYEIINLSAPKNLSTFWTLHKSLDKKRDLSLVFTYTHTLSLSHTHMFSLSHAHTFLILTLFLSISFERTES